MALKGPTTNHEEIEAWAHTNRMVPVTVEPQRLDAEPASMALLHKETATTTSRVKEMEWQDFFERFDLLGLTLVYDDATVYNEILQVEKDNASIPPAYRKIAADQLN